MPASLPACSRRLSSLRHRHCTPSALVLLLYLGGMAGQPAGWSVSRSAGRPIGTYSFHYIQVANPYCDSVLDLPSRPEGRFACPYVPVVLPSYSE